MPFHCIDERPEAGFQPVRPEKPLPTAKILLDEEPEMASKGGIRQWTTWVQLVPLKFQMPAPPTTQTSVAEIASTALVASLPAIVLASALHVVPLNCRS